MEKIVLASFEFDTEQISKAKDENAKLKAEIIALRREQSETNKVIKESGQVTEQQAASLAKNEAKLKNLNKTYQDNIKVINANASSTDAVNKLLTEQIKTEQQAINNISKLTQARKGLNKDSETYSKQLDAINAKIDQNNEFLTEAGDAYTKQKRNIGNYTESIREALSSQNLFNGSLAGFGSATSALQPLIGGLREQTKQLSVNYTKLTSGTQGMTLAQKASTAATFVSANAFKILKIAVASTGIGLLIIALGSLGAYLSSTQKGMDLLSRVMGQLGAAVDVIIDRFAKIGGILIGLISGQKSLSEAWGEGKDALSGLGDELAREVELAGRLIDAQQKLEKQEQLLSFRRAATNNELKQLNKTVEDTAKSTTERIAAAQKISDIESEIARKEEENANKALALALGKEEVDAQTLSTLDKLKEGTIEYDELLSQLGISESTKEDVEEFLGLYQKQQEAAARTAEVLTTNQNKQNTLLNQVASEEKKRSDDAKKQEEDRLKAIQARQDAAIQAAKEELDLFQFTFDKKNATVSESLDFEQNVSDQRLAILDKEFEAGKLSKTAYELEKAKIAQDQLTATSQIVLDQASRELAIYDQTNKSRIDSNKLLTDEILKAEDERINSLLERQREFARLKLEQGVINEQQYADEVAKIDADAQAKKDEVEALKREQEEEARAINLENLIAYRQLVGESEFTLKKEQLERDRLAEIEQANGVGADIALINKKYEKLKTNLTQDENQRRLENTVDTLQQVSGALQSLGLESKEITSALALADTLAAIVKVFKDETIQPFPAKFAAAAVIGARGFANVARINSIKFAQGGEVDGMQRGPSHSDGGMLFTVRNRKNYVGEFEGNEFIVNKKAAQRHRTLLERINSDRFADGGIVPGNIGQSVSSAVSSNSMTPEQVLTAIESRVARLEVVNLASETYKVATSEIRVKNEAVR